MKKNYPDLAACEKFKQIIKNYTWDNPSWCDNNKEMQKMHASDRKDMRKVLSLYKKGEWEQACEVAGHMDTSPREYIPQRIWDDINS